MNRFLRLHCIFICAAASVGCKWTHPYQEQIPNPKDFVVPVDMPRELSKTVLPTYTVEPPDLLIIEAINIVPRSPYFLRTGDAVALIVNGTLPESPILGSYPVQPGGTVNLGTPYGTVKISGMTVEQAQTAVQDHLRAYLQEPNVSLSLASMSGLQQIAGTHLVTPDGNINLGSYGSVPVVGLTLAQTRAALEKHLSEFMEDPVLSVDVFSYNSKVFYIITEGAGLGDQVVSLPSTGNETVLDAMASIGGMTQLSSKRIWIARAVPECEDMVILPVDWQSVTAGGVASTNYQILPGDRLFIAEDRWVAADTNLGKFLGPIERVFGFSLLTVGTLSRFSGRVLQNNGNNQGGGGFQ